MNLTDNELQMLLSALEAYMEMVDDPAYLDELQELLFKLEKK